MNQEEQYKKIIEENSGPGSTFRYVTKTGIIRNLNKNDNLRNIISKLLGSGQKLTDGVLRRIKARDANIFLEYQDRLEEAMLERSTRERSTKKPSTKEQSSEELIEKTQVEESIAEPRVEEEELPMPALEDKPAIKQRKMTVEESREFRRKKLEAEKQAKALQIVRTTEKIEQLSDKSQQLSTEMVVYEEKLRDLAISYPELAPKGIYEKVGEFAETVLGVTFGVVDLGTSMLAEINDPNSEFNYIEGEKYTDRVKRLENFFVSKGLDLPTAKRLSVYGINPGNTVLSIAKNREEIKRLAAEGSNALEMARQLYNETAEKLIQVTDKYQKFKTKLIESEAKKLQIESSPQYSQETSTELDFYVPMAKEIIEAVPDGLTNSDYNDIIDSIDPGVYTRTVLERAGKILGGSYPKEVSLDKINKIIKKYSEDFGLNEEDLKSYSKDLVMYYEDYISGVPGEREKVISELESGQVIEDFPYFFRDPSMSESVVPPQGVNSDPVLQEALKEYENALRAEFVQRVSTGEMSPSVEEVSAFEIGVPPSTDKFQSESTGPSLVSPTPSLVSPSLPPSISPAAISTTPGSAPPPGPPPGPPPPGPPQGPPPQGPQIVPQMPLGPSFAVEPGKEPHEPKYHKTTVKLYLGSPPEFDRELEANVYSSGMSESEIIRSIDSIIKEHGNDLFVYKRLSSSIDEFHELVQCQFCILRNLQRGTRSKIAMVPIKELISFANKINPIQEQIVPRELIAPATTTSSNIVLGDMTPNAQQVQISVNESMAKVVEAYRASKFDQFGRPIFNSELIKQAKVKSFNKPNDGSSLIDPGNLFLPKIAAFNIKCREKEKIKTLNKKLPML